MVHSGVLLESVRLVIHESLLGPSERVRSRNIIFAFDGCFSSSKLLSEDSTTWPSIFTGGVFFSFEFEQPSLSVKLATGQLQLVDASIVGCQTKIDITLGTT